MIIILGLIILAAALIVGVAGVLCNGGAAHAVSHFSVFGYHLTGSAGSLFLRGIVVGAAALAGLSLLLAGARRTARRASAARRGLRQSRRETAAATQQRDDLIDQRDTARAAAASPLGNGPVTSIRNLQPSPAADRWGRLRSLGHRFTPAQNASQPGSPAPDEPAILPGPERISRSAASDAPAGGPDQDLAAASPAPDAHASASPPAQ
jgi:hypothetical protein